jgi:hypothetical protein
LANPKHVSTFTYNTNGKKMVASHQGDQVGRFFSSWVIVYFGSFLEMKEVAKVFGLLSFKVKVIYILHNHHKNREPILRFLNLQLQRQRCM